MMMPEEHQDHTWHGEATHGGNATNKRKRVVALTYNTNGYMRTREPKRAHAAHAHAARAHANASACKRERMQARAAHATPTHAAQARAHAVQAHEAQAQER